MTSGETLGRSALDGGKLGRGCEELPRRAQAVLERDLRAPAELARGEARVEHRALQVAETLRAVLRIDLAPGGASHRVDQLEHRRRLPGRYVHDAAGRG